MPYGQPQICREFDSQRLGKLIVLCEVFDAEDSHEKASNLVCY